MFTGLVEEIGTVNSITPSGDGMIISITANKVMEDIGVDDSISVDGCCLTVTEHTDETFTVTAVAETLKKTTLGTRTRNDSVNLERAIRMGDRLGGHLVQGHVDVVGIIQSIVNNVEGLELWISFPAPFRKWLIPTGSVCVNGISLTVAELEQERFKIAVIPHTLSVTTMGTSAVGDAVNLEFDMMAKYAENFAR